MAEKEVILTQTGLKKIEDELEHLKVVKRKEVSQRIKEALAFGDISENSEYDEAKNEQAEVESRIAKLENILKYAKVIDESDINSDEVSVGVKVKVLDLDFNEEELYTIVGATEADPANYAISNESPIGGALIGKKVGDKVEIQVPAGIVRYKVLDITR